MKPPRSKRLSTRKPRGGFPDPKGNFSIGALQRATMQLASSPLLTFPAEQETATDPLVDLTVDETAIDYKTARQARRREGKSLQGS